MKRRTFFSTAALAVAGAASPVATAGAAVNRPPGLIDTNVYLSDWPVRHSWARTPTVLVDKLRRHGVVSAWTGSFDAVLHSDIGGANARLTETCEREGGGLLAPFGTVNPRLPDWEEDLRRCDEVHRMQGVRLFPTYHGYDLKSVSFARLIDLATRRKLVVQIALSIEDFLGENPVLAAGPSVTLTPLGEVLDRSPGARIMLLNGGSGVLTASNAVLPRLIAAGVLFDIAGLEGVAGIEAALARNGAARIAFGSYAPYFYFESALLKLQESELTPAQFASVSGGFARAALDWS